MSKPRVSEVELITNIFETTDLTTAKVLHQVVNSTMKRRLASVASAAAPAKAPVTRKSAKSTVISPAPVSTELAFQDSDAA